MRPSSVQLPSPHLALDLDTEQKWLLSEITELAEVGYAAALSVQPVGSACTSYLAAAASHPCSAGLHPQRTISNPQILHLTIKSLYSMAGTLLMLWTGPALNTTVKCMPPISASV